jgi:drug/metabolite transporter (DMT)-like permease
MAKTAETRGVWLAVWSALFFSAKAIFVKLAYPYGVGPVALLALRMAFAVPFFAVAVLRSASAAEPLTRRDLAIVTVLGLFGYYGAAILDFLGLQYISAGLERLIVFTYPTLTLLIAVFAFGRPFGRADVVALIVTWVGVALAFAHDLDFAGDAQAVWLGAGYVLLSSICYAIYLAGAGEVVARLGSLRVSALAACVSSLAIFVHFAATRPFAELAQPAPVLLLAAVMALFSTVLPVFLQMAAIRRLGAARAAVIGTVGPVTTIVLGALVLREPVSAVQVAGTVLVLLGVTLAGRRRDAGVA